MVKQAIKELLKIICKPVVKPVDIPGLDEFKLMADEVQQRFLFTKEDYYPCLNDNTANTDFDRHYIYHPAWAARVVKIINPDFHIDISSTLHFSTILSAFIPVKFFDYRPAKLELANLSSQREDLMSLSFASGSVHSLSCMHTIEHIGLGRYGDKIDYDGDLKAVAELSRVLAKGGNLLFVTPVGATARIQFNAHRIYTKQLVANMFANHGLKLKEFCLIPENEADGGLVVNPNDDLMTRQVYACGCFWFTK
ncbi:MAG: hypothetical protein JWR02_2305 [Mucilaginibacter sp.]|nr:hypothetical protein [Mucilaginibacter sp.]